MRRRSIAGGCLCFLALCVARTSSAARAEAPPDPSPVDLIACRTSFDVPHGPRRGPLIDVVTFAVRGDRAADLVRFSVVRADGSVHTFTARGVFAPNVVIEGRHLPVDPEAPDPWFRRENRERCVTTYVHFGDGTTWSGHV